MAGIAILYEVPRDPSQLARWSSIHQAHHLDIISTLQAQNPGLEMPLYPLDPFDPRSEVQMAAWNDQHQDMHSQMNQLLNYQGFNLLEPNWEDQRELAEWILQHSQEHQNAANVLGIG